MDHNEIGVSMRSCIDWPHERDYSRAPLNSVLNFWSFMNHRAS